MFAYKDLQCVDVIHPGKANIPKTEVAQKVAQMYKVQQACVMVRLTLLFNFFHILFTIVKSAFLLMQNLIQSSASNICNS